ncbi:hypothetical protein [Acinetobacter colistiniresistens]|uniref:Lipoprotein n=1 Tax=Acinetobacter colistiniresistens TaxID=280145 RepID=A0A558EZ23_9GAMM|nr:hypothetical protein [Acinetobacter colistiniresistens]TVT78615.1 hypothetical protein FPV60_16820 [Acinetobacter colistiniresistens]
MKKILLIVLAFSLFGCEKPDNEKTLEQARNDLSGHIEAKNAQDKSATQIDPNMDIVELAICTAASMKIGEGIGVYRAWTEELTRRYKKTYPTKSQADVENYVSERIDDKLRYLKGKGLDTKQSFSKYYRENCKS